MSSLNDTSVLKYDNIIVSTRGVTESDGKKVVLFVSSTEIDHIEVKFGRSSHRLFLSLPIGAVFTIIGIYGLIHLILAPAGFRYELAMVAFGVIGGSIIFDDLKKRYFFEVHRKKDICRLVFSRNARLEGVQNFCRQIEEAHKLQIKLAC